MNIELVYFEGCPNVERARANLRIACTTVGLKPAWRECEKSAAETPEKLRNYASPTILVDNVDIAGEEGAKGDACRLYKGSDGALSGAPDVPTIARALIGRQRGGRGMRRASP